MFLVLSRANAHNAPFNMTMLPSFATREEAEKFASTAAGDATKFSFFVVEVLSKHRARFEVEVTKP